MPARPLVSVVLGRSAYIRQENAGEGAACDAGLRVGTGDYIACLDADDLWLPETLVVSLGHPASLFDGRRIRASIIVHSHIPTRLGSGEPADD